MKVCLSMPTVMPSAPLDFEFCIRFRADDSSDRVAGRTRKAPLTMRGGRGASRCPAAAAVPSEAAMLGPTEAKC